MAPREPAKVVPIGAAATRIPEPDWAAIFDNEQDRAEAREHWRKIIIELRETGRLSRRKRANPRRDLRLAAELVKAYIDFDHLSRLVAKEGAVITPKRGDPRIHPRFDELKRASDVALALEVHLRITRRRRGPLTAADRKANRAKRIVLDR